MKEFKSSELILNPDKSIYHIHLKPENIADTVILVGDPGRVASISIFFDSIECKIQNREFVTHTGFYKGKRLSVVATGIGTDNIDIVLNEIDALFNIDFETLKIKENLTSIRLVRLGTTGALQAGIEPGTSLISKTSIGFDGLLNFYANRNLISNQKLEAAFVDYTNWNKLLARPYFVDADLQFYNQLKEDFTEALTISSPGFYGPQGRVLRLPIEQPELNDKISSFRFEERKITNYEMESSALYALSKLLNHKAVTICTVIANRITGKFLNNYHEPMEKMIVKTLDNLVK